MDTRQELIESICNVANDNTFSDAQKSMAKALLVKVLSASATTNIKELYADYYAILAYKELGYFASKELRKSVYEQVKSFKKGKIPFGVETSIFLASLLVHSFLEMRHDTTLDPEELGIPDLIDLIKDSSNDKINQFLQLYGYYGN